MSVVTEDDFLIALNSEAQYNNEDNTAVFDAVYQAPEMSANSILSLFDSNRDQRMSFVMQILEIMDDGRTDPRLIHVKLKNMEDIFAMFNDPKKYPITATAYRKMLMSECEKWGKSFEFHNSTFSIRGTASKGDYSMCNCPELEQLEAKYLEAKNELENYKDFLDMLPISGVEMIDKQTGELYTIYPPAKPKNETVVVKLS